MKMAWPPGGRTIGMSRAIRRLGHIFHRRVTIALIFVFQCLHQPDGDCLQIAPRKPAVGRKSFGQDQHIAEILGPFIVMAAEKSADIRQAVFLGAHRGAVGERKHLLRDLQEASFAEARLVFLDEIGIFRIAAGVDNQRNILFLQRLLDRSYILQRNGLAAASVVRDGDHAERNVLRAFRLDQVLELAISMFPLNRLSE